MNTQPNFEGLTKAQVDNCYTEAERFASASGVNPASIGYDKVFEAALVKAADRAQRKGYKARCAADRQAVRS